MPGRDFSRRGPRIRTAESAPVRWCEREGDEQLEDLVEKRNPRGTHYVAQLLERLERYAAQAG